MGLTRTIHADTKAALQRVFYPIVMVHLDWPGGHVYAHSGAGTISWGGKSWLGVGKFGGIEVPGEAPGLAASQASLTLIGDPAALFDLLTDPIRNRPGEIYEALTTVPGGNVLIGQPISLFTGYMDAMRYRLMSEEEDGRVVVDHVVQIDIGSGPGARSSAAVLHSYEDQIDKFPGDTAGRFLINIEAEVENQRWPAN